MPTDPPPFEVKPSITWGTPGKLGTIAAAKAARKPSLVEAFEAVHRALGVSSGRLEKPLLLTTATGPIGLGFLGLTLEMFSSRVLVEPARAEVQVTWMFGREHATINVRGAVTSPVGPLFSFDFAAGLDARNLNPGVVTVSQLQLLEPLRVRTKKREKYRPCSVGFRVRIVGEGEPTGAVPAAHGGQFLPLAA